MDSSYSDSSVQQTTEPALFCPPLPTKPLPTPAEMDNWLSDLDAANDDQISSIPSVDSGEIQLRVDPEDITDLIYSVIVQRKPTRPNKILARFNKRIPDRIDANCDDKNRIEPFDASKYVELPNTMGRTRISRVVHQQTPAAANKTDLSFSSSSSTKRKLAADEVTKSAKKRKLMMTIPDDLAEQQVMDIDDQPIITPAPVNIQGLPVATTKKSLPTSSLLKRKRQVETAPSKKPRMQKNDEITPTADSMAQVPDPETLFRQAFQNVAEHSKVEIKNITGLTIYRVNLLADKLCEKVDKTKRNSKYRLI